MYGFATNETPELMPLPITLAHGLTRKLAEVRKNNTVTWMRPDSKAQVTVEYENGKAKRVDAIVVSTQHDPQVTNEQIVADVKQYVIRQRNSFDLRNPYYRSKTSREKSCKSRIQNSNHFRKKQLDLQLVSIQLRFY